GLFQNELDLAVHAAQVLLRPALERLVESRVKTQEKRLPRFHRSSFTFRPGCARSNSAMKPALSSGEIQNGSSRPRALIRIRSSDHASPQPTSALSLLVE